MKHKAAHLSKFEKKILIMKTNSRREFLRNSALISGGFVISPSRIIPDAERGNAHRGISEELSNHTLFSFDDHSIPWKRNLQLTMIQAQKYEENPVVPRGDRGSVDEYAVQFYGSILKHEGKFKMWYIAMDEGSMQLAEGSHNYLECRIAYAESDDGIHWNKPNLGLVEYRGNRNNNLVFVDPPYIGGLHLIVLHEQDEPDPDRRFKMMLTVTGYMEGGKDKSQTSIALFSSDGFHWKSGTKVSFDEEGILQESDFILPVEYFEQGGLYKWKGAYHLAGQKFDWWINYGNTGRVMKIYRSPDLIHWDSAMSDSFRRDDPSLPARKKEEAHLASSIWHRNNLVLGIYGMWHADERAEYEYTTIDLGFMISNDGINFREPIRDFVLIKRGDDGDWDEGGLLQGQGFANIEDKTYIWYGCWDPRKRENPPRGGVGLATLRRDGFGYLDKINEGASSHFITRTIERHELKSEQLSIFINLEGVDKQNPLSIELVDGRGIPIPAFSGNNAAIVTEEGLNIQVVWQDPGLNEMQSKESDFAIKVNYPDNRNARVYALYLA